MCSERCLRRTAADGFCGGAADASLLAAVQDEVAKGLPDQGAGRLTKGYAARKPQVSGFSALHTASHSRFAGHLPSCHAMTGAQVCAGWRSMLPSFHCCPEVWSSSR